MLAARGTNIQWWGFVPFTIIGVTVELFHQACSKKAMFILKHFRCSLLPLPAPLFSLQ